MVSRSAAPTEVPPFTVQPRSRFAARVAADHAPSLARSALEFAARCHAGSFRDSDGAPFIEHPLEVARLLRDAGCSGVVVAAGLLHDVVEDTDVSVAELSAEFGAGVADLVQAVTDDASQSYRQRKRVLREQVRNAGIEAALLFAAEMIAQVRELPARSARDIARIGATARGSRARNHLELYQQMRLEHLHESLGMLQDVAARHPLVKRLANELDACPIVDPGGRRAAARRIDPRGDRDCG